MISPESVDRIINAARIEEVVSDFVKLRKRGINLLGLCPFHNEKTPSFTVSPVKGIFKCFGCGKSGNSIGFIMEHEQLSYPEALRYVAQKYHIDIEETASSPEQQQKHSDREAQYILLAAAQKFFTDELHHSSEGKTIGLSYFKERALSAKTMDDFGLGWAPLQRNSLAEWAEKNAYSHDLLIKTGLCFEGREGGLYDRFHERVMFPIYNLSGKIAGFGGRIIRSDSKEAKYINSPETEIYNKSRLLYGFFQAKKAIRQQDSAILVEGYMDVLSLHQSGIENAVASSGTSLTEDQLRLIKRFTENVIFFFDGDEAGKKASIRSLDLALSLEMNPRVATLPPEHDPDSFARTYDKEYITDFLARESKDFLQYRLSLVPPEQKDDPLKKATLARELLESLLQIKDNLQRAFYIKEIEKVLALEEKFLYEELRRMQMSQFRSEKKEQNVTLPPAPTQEKAAPLTNATLQERQIIRLLIHFGSLMMDDENTVASAILTEINELEIEDPVCLKILEIFNASVADGFIPHEEIFLQHPEAEIQHLVIDLMQERYTLNIRWKEYIGREIPNPEDNYRIEVKRSLLHLRLRKIEQLILENQKQLKEATLEDCEILLNVKKQLDNFKLEIGKELGTIIL